MSRGASKTTFPLVRNVATSSAPSSSKSDLSSALETRWLRPTFTPRRKAAYLTPGRVSNARVREPELQAVAQPEGAVHSSRGRPPDRRSQGLAPHVRVGPARPALACPPRGPGADLRPRHLHAVRGRRARRADHGAGRGPRARGLRLLDAHGVLDAPADLPRRPPRPPERPASPRDAAVREHPARARLLGAVRGRARHAVGARLRLGLPRRLPRIRHDPLPRAPSPATHGGGQADPRAPHAPPLPGR